jgi:hypothetical protein
VANTEEALQGLQAIFEQSFPTFLRAVELEYTDGVILESLQEITWEDDDPVDNGFPMPGAMLVPESEVDDSLRDLLYTCNITVIMAFQDSEKRNATKKMLRYAKALRRMLRPVNNRSLLGKVNSAKVADIRWLPLRVSVQSGGLFVRGFEADLIIRLPKESD